MRAFVFGCGILLVALANVVSAEGPNILFILADDMGWQDTSVPFSGGKTPLNERFRTPSLERLANEGMLFTQAYACTVCSPSRITLITGQNEARHRVTQWTRAGGDQPTTDLPHPRLLHSDWNWNGLQPVPDYPHGAHAVPLPQCLQQAGYRTIHIGKGHLGASDTPGADPAVFGFDVRIGGRAGGGPGSYSGLQNFGAAKDPRAPGNVQDLDQYHGQDIHLTEALTREADREIRNAVETGKPFFCYLAHFAPHTPIQPDERFAPRYRTAGLDKPEAAYASLIEGMDKSVGDLLALLDELEIARQTIVIFMSDNGGLSHWQRGMDPPHTHNRPLSSGKGSHHEGGIRVPLLVRWPGVVKASSVCDTPVIMYDWLPTLCGITRAPLPSAEDLDGVNLLPLLKGETADNSFARSLVWHFPNFWGPMTYTSVVEGPGMGPSSTIRRGDWKLIYYHDGPRFELFNLRDDLGETTDRSRQQPERVTSLAAELGAYLRSRHAVMPVVRETGNPVPWPDAGTDPGSAQLHE